MTSPLRQKDVTVAREFDSNKGCVKVMYVCQFMKRYESYAGGILKELYILEVTRLSGGCDSCQGGKQVIKDIWVAIRESESVLEI